VGNVVVKSLFIAVALALAAFSALIFEAASSTALALNDIDAAQASQAPNVRAMLLDRAAETLLQSWAEPTRWHGGATEALSAAYFLEGRANHDPALLAASARYAEITVRLGPVSPHAWVRLAALAELGAPNSLCSLRDCLAMSWRVARMIDPDTGCERLGLAWRHNLLTPNDRRIDDYLQSKPARDEAIRCLAFLPAGELFARVLDANLPGSAPGARR